MRYNLDPFEQFDDSDLWGVLEEVELKDVIEDMPGGLSAMVNEGGANLSMGQRQLVCLARAILRNSRVLVLDEATASVDRHTDALIQATIKRRFAHCTVLTVAHRLYSIMDSDRILVMERGCAMEFGPPHILLQNQNGIFSSLVTQAGNEGSAQIRAFAERCYNEKCALISSGDDS